MADTDDEKLMAAAAQEAIKKFHATTITIESRIATWLDLIAMVQLALRHPGTAGQPSAQRSEKFIRDLIERIDPDHGAIWQLLQLGFDPDHDQ